MQEQSKFCSSCGRQNYIGAASCQSCRKLFTELQNIKFRDIAPAEKLEHRQEVVIVDFQMPFWSMVLFMVKWSIAAIPAVIILIVIGLLLPGILIGIGVGSR